VTDETETQARGGHRLIADIEVLRAVAILFTVYHHRHLLLFWGIDWRSESYVTFWGGVDLFFVISGFVIARSALPAWAAATSRAVLGRAIVAFWIRRFWRIWPTLLFWMGVVAVLGAVTRAGVWKDFLTNIPGFTAILSGVENIHAYYVEQGPGLRGTLALAPSWSLSLEEQFYLAFPALVFFVRRQHLAKAVAAGILMQLFLPREVWSFAWAIRSDALLLGVAIAMSLSNPVLRDLLEPRFLRGRGLACWSMTGLLLFINAGMAAQHVVPFYTGLVAIVSAVLVWLASYDRGYVLPAWRFKSLLVWIGARSYAIYMVHIPAYFFTREIWAHLLPPDTHFDSRFSGHFVLTSLVLILILAELNYRFIETPLRIRGAGIARRFLGDAQK
jgi:peptidoglycan/LPS O-acetylase OafA/YrhL